MSKLSYKLTLYSFPRIDKLKNSIIEGMEHYLENYPVAGGPYDNLQPFSLAPNLSIRISASEFTAAQLRGPNYARIFANGFEEPSTGHIFYYFVDKLTRLANQTIQLDLSIDSLNTFSGIIEYGGMTPRTMTAREHRDRFYQDGEAISYPLSLTLRRRIDRIGEGFAPLKLKIGETAIRATAGPDLDWYLIYKSKYDTGGVESNNPVSCYLLASSSIPVVPATSGAVQTLPYDRLDESTFYYLTPQSAPSFSITFEKEDGSGDVTLTAGQSVEGCSHIDVITLKRTSDTYIDIYASSTDPESGVAHFITMTKTSITLNVCKSIRSLTYGTTQLDLINAGQLTIYNSGTSAKKSTIPYSELKTDDSTLVKIIRLPYPPCEVTYDATDGVYLFPPEWSLQNNGILKLNNLHTEFGFSLPDRKVYHLAEDITLPSWNTERTLIDSKLYHSDFYTLKYSYDVFSIDFKLEYFNREDSDDKEAYLIPIFKPTNTINSNFLFTFPFKEDAFSYWSSDDYHVLLSSRNNEMTIFSNDYLNYLKNGYNYDKKAKAVESESRWIGAALTMAGAVVSAVKGGPIGTLGAISLGISAIDQATNAINGQITADNTQNQKLQQLRAEASSVSGCDDVDLLKAYTDNRLHEITLWPNDETREMLNDYFYFFGYATNRQKVPEMHNRIWFNYVQCTPYFTDGAFEILSPYLDDISQKLQAGVTIFHEVTTTSTGSDGTAIVKYEWDFDQVKENLESWFKS